MRWTTNTTTMRERSRRASAARLQLAVGRRGLGSKKQGRPAYPARVFRGTNHTRVRTEQQLIELGSDAWLKETTHGSAPVHLFAVKLQSVSVALDA